MISIVIPAYNESVNLSETIQEICKVFQMSEWANCFEIIVVDDHSSDDTYEKLKALMIKELKVLRLSRRSGSHTALRAGLQEAKGNAIACISADGQEDPKIILSMLLKWKNGADIVWALRKSRQDEPFYIKLPAQIFYLLLKWLANTSQADNGILSRADFYLLDRKVANAINSCNERYTSLFGLILWSGFKQDFVEYDRKPRRYGKSKWNFTSRLNFAKDWIIAFSGIPLKAMIGLGFAISFLGFLYAAFIMFTHFFYSHDVQGWASLMVVVLILGGLNISILGLIGEYLWRNLEETRKRPLYFIEKNSSEEEKIPRV